MTAPVIADDLITAVGQVIAWSLEEHGVAHERATETARSACADLCAHWGGSEHWLPAHYRPTRNIAIIQAVRSGEPVAVISARLCVSEATVRRVKRQSSGLGSDDWVL